MTTTLQQERNIRCEEKGHASLSMTFHGLVHEIENTDAMEFAPPREVGRSETPIGTVNDPFTRKLYSLARKYRKHSALEAINLENNPQDEALRAHCRELEYKANVLHNLFTLSVRTELNAFSIRTISVRQGWVAVDLNMLSELNQNFESL